MYELPWDSVGNLLSISSAILVFFCQCRQQVMQTYKEVHYLIDFDVKTLLSIRQH